MSLYGNLPSETYSILPPSFLTQTTKEKIITDVTYIENKSIPKSSTLPKRVSNVGAFSREPWNMVKNKIGKPTIKPIKQLNKKYIRKLTHPIFKTKFFIDIFSFCYKLFRIQISRLHKRCRSIEVRLEERKWDGITFVTILSTPFIAKR